MNDNIVTPTGILDALNGLTSHSESKDGVLFIKLHGLEHIGTIIGARFVEHVISDLTLQFQKAVRHEDTVLRTGRFEFIILLSDILNRGHAILAATKIAGILDLPILINEQSRKHPFSIGIALTPQDTSDPEELFRYAELAAIASQLTNMPYQEYSFDKIDDVVTDWDIEGELEKSIIRNELSLSYQPQVSARTGELIGAEALMRWNHPVHGTVQPSKFIPVAEQIGIMPKLTWWCLNTALREHQSWGNGKQSLSVAINVSASDLTDKGFAKAVSNAIGIWGIQPQLLTIEITESSLMMDIEQSARILSKIQNNGVRIAIDDFGTGYSSLSYFKQLPVDELKIDRSFITNILESDLDLHIVNTITKMASALDLNVVAEGVELEDVKKILHKLGCHTIQGFYYSKPLPLPDFIEWVKSYRRSK